MSSVPLPQCHLSPSSHVIYSHYVICHHVMWSVTLLCHLSLSCHVICAPLPHGVEIKHGRLELCKLYGCDADSPDVTLLVVASFPLHRSDLWGHPGETTQNRITSWKAIWIYHSVSYHRADSRLVPSQWEMTLLYNDVSHWLGTSLESALYHDTNLSLNFIIKVYILASSLFAFILDVGKVNIPISMVRCKKRQT